MVVHLWVNTSVNQPYCTIMKKKVALLILASGFLSGSITFAALYSNNNVKECQSCNKSSCTVKTVSAEPERPLVAL